METEYAIHVVTGILKTPPKEEKPNTHTHTPKFVVNNPHAKSLDYNIPCPHNYLSRPNTFSKAVIPPQVIQDLLNITEEASHICHTLGFTRSRKIPRFTGGCFWRFSCLANVKLKCEHG